MPQRLSRLLAAGLVASIAAAGAQARVDDRAAPEIAALRQADLRARSASLGTAKLDATLARAAHNTPRGRVEVVVAPARGHLPAARRAVVRAGGHVDLVAGGLVQAKVPAKRLRSLARRPVVRRLSAPVRPVELGTGNEGVDSTNARVWQAAGLTGKGVKVAIIDGGFGGLAQKQAAGAVNANATTVDYCGGSGANDTHGTAVAEIVSAEAPDAQLLLICVDTEVALAAAEKYAQDNGARVISMSLGFYGTWGGDGRGPAGTPDATVAAARAAGILWVNAAGNDGVGHWRGTFADVNGDGFAEIGPTGDETDSFLLPQADGVCVFMRWNEWPNATHDYDLLLVREPSGVTAAASGADQFDQHGEPSESACYINNSPGTLTIGFAVAAPHGSPAPSPPIDVFVEARPFSARLEYATAAGSISDPAASPNVLAVGATCWQTNELEFYSSEGPTVDGRLKPDLVAPDSVSSSVFGPFVACGRSGFAGTSASAPFAAGAAALVAQRFPTYRAEQIQAYLVAHAHDLGAPGADDEFGAGEVFLPTLDDAPRVSAPTFSAVRAHAARAAATVSALESATKVEIEYGRTLAYGSSVAGRVAPGKGTDATATALLSGLRAATTYHVRAVATGYGGTVQGPDRTFHTPRARR